MKTTFQTDMNIAQTIPENGPPPKFKVGDRVTFTNDQGVVFPARIVAEIEWTRYGHWRGWGYRLAGFAAPWFANREDQISICRP